MKRKHLPRLWCALQGLLPLEARPGEREAARARPRARPGDSPGDAAEAGWGSDLGGGPHAAPAGVWGGRMPGR